VTPRPYPNPKRHPEEAQSTNTRLSLLLIFYGPSEYDHRMPRTTLTKTTLPATSSFLRHLGVLLYSACAYGVRNHHPRIFPGFWTHLAGAGNIPCFLVNSALLGFALLSIVLSALESSRWVWWEWVEEGVCWRRGERRSEKRSCGSKWCR